MTTTLIIVWYCAEDGELLKARCFDENHAMRLEQSLDASGCAHWRNEAAIDWDNVEIPDARDVARDSQGWSF